MLKALKGLQVSAVLLCSPDILEKRRQFTDIDLGISQAIVQTLVSALPAIGELAVMLLVIFLIFAVINVNLFGGMCVEGKFCYDVNVSRFNC